MSKKIKQVKKHNQRYKNFSFSELMTKADEEHLEAILEMDDNGNVLVESKFDKQGELEEKNTLKYSPDGKLIEHHLDFVMDGFTEKRILRRDEKGKLLEETKYYGEDRGERTEYEYDEQDRIKAIIEYDEEGEFISRETITYDPEGSISERVKNDQSGNLIEKVLFEKTNDKNVILEKEFNFDGELQLVTTISLDDKGKEVSSHQSSPSGKLISGVVTTYDEMGNILERHFNDVYPKTVKYEYDEKGRMLSQELFDAGGLLQRKNIYEYDDAGNLLTEQTFEMDNSRGGKEKHFGTRYEYEFYS
jgi:YD repeat-containing protein